MTRKEVYKEIDIERDYQYVKWGGKEHDEKENIASFITYMENYLRASAYHTSHGTDHAALEELRKVVALGVACLEINGCPSRPITW